MGEERIVTVGELMVFLGKMPEDADVVMRFFHPHGVETHHIEKVKLIDVGLPGAPVERCCLDWAF